jgi:hypothetical protein
VVPLAAARRAAVVNLAGDPRAAAASPVVDLRAAVRQAPTQPAAVAALRDRIQAARLVAAVRAVAASPAVASPGVANPGVVRPAVAVPMVLPAVSRVAAQVKPAAALTRAQTAVVAVRAGGVR